MAEWITVLPCDFVTPTLGTNLNTCLFCLQETVVAV